MIAREMERDEAFAAEIQHHESNPEIGFMRNIQDAAQKAQYWRAAAWWLERRRPEDFGTKKPGMVTVAQFGAILSSLTQIITEEVLEMKKRKIIIKRLDKLVADILGDLCTKSSKDHIETGEETMADEELSHE